MNIVLAGAGVTAHRLAQTLMVDHQVVSLRRQDSDGHGFEALDVETVFGDPASPDALRLARVEEADVFIGCTAIDEQNIVACLAAQKLGVKQTICVLSRHGFFSLRDAHQDLAKSLDIDLVIRPGEQLAQEIIRIVTVPGALDVRVFAEGRVGLLRYRVEEGAPILRGPLKSLALPRGAVLVTIVRGDELIVPHGGTRLRAGDYVVAMGRRDSVQALSELMRRANTRASKTAAIIGAGGVGLAIAHGLEDAGWSVKLIETDPDRCERVASQLRSMVLHGDGADLELLEEERIGDSSVVVCVTNNDEKNLLVSLLAKSLGVPRIITRADRHTNERMFEKVGVDVVLSTRGAALRSIVQHLDTDHQEIRSELEHGLACVIELKLPPSFTTTKLRDLSPPEHSVVGAITRDQRVLIPGGNDELQAGDQLLVFCRTANEAEVQRFFVGPSPANGDA